MLKCVAVIVGAAFHGVASHQVVGQPNVEIVEPGSLEDSSLDYLSVCRDLIADEGVIQNLEV